jgi:hypothetical protein
MQNLRTKLSCKQMANIFFMFVGQEIVSNKTGLLQTHWGEFVSEFVAKFVGKFVANMWWLKRTFRVQYLECKFEVYLIEQHLYISIFL